jgi:hypothetical protein
MILARIAELLPYPSRSITVASAYDEWQESRWARYRLIQEGENVFDQPKCCNCLPRAVLAEFAGWHAPTRARSS